LNLQSRLQSRFHLKNSQWQLLCFLLVGSTAAVVHETVVIACVECWQMDKLDANTVGFFIAFMVSYLGHRQLTFSQGNTVVPTHCQALPRFFIVAFLSFLLNQALYAALLAYTVLPYALALCVVLLSVAVLTFVLGKLWAFKPS
jgi:putative flippase GtrA